MGTPTYPEASIFAPFDEDPEGDASFAQRPVITPGAQNTAGRGFPNGNHGELSPSHPDVLKARVAAAEVAGEYTAAPYPNHPGTAPAHAPAGHVDSTTLAGLD